MARRVEQLHLGAPSLLCYTIPGRNSLIPFPYSPLAVSSLAEGQRVWATPQQKHPRLSPILLLMGVGRANRLVPDRTLSRQENPPPKRVLLSDPNEKFKENLRFSFRAHSHLGKITLLKKGNSVAFAKSQRERRKLGHYNSTQYEPGGKERFLFHKRTLEAKADETKAGTNKGGGGENVRIHRWPAKR